MIWSRKYKYKRNPELISNWEASLGSQILSALEGGALSKEELSTQLGVSKSSVNRGMSTIRSKIQVVLSGKSTTYEIKDKT